MGPGRPDGPTPGQMIGGQTSPAKFGNVFGLDKLGETRGADQCAMTAAAPQPLGALPWQHPTEDITLANIDEAMRYQGWDPDQQAAGDIVREALTFAAKAVLRHVPCSPRRTLAVQHILSARMDANAAISFRGRF